MQLNEISMVEVKKYNGELDWTANLYDTDVFAFLYNDTVVAEAVLFEDFDSIIIDNIKTRIYMKGIGTLAIKKISDYARSKDLICIKGESVSEAVGFWSRFNAQFDEEDNNSLTPFKIMCNNVDSRFEKFIKEI